MGFRETLNLTADEIANFAAQEEFDLDESNVQLKRQSTFHYTRGITPKRVTLSASPQLSTWAKQRRNGGELLATMSDLTCPGIEP